MADAFRADGERLPDGFGAGGFAGVVGESQARFARLGIEGAKGLGAGAALVSAQANSDDGRVSGLEFGGFAEVFTVAFGTPDLFVKIPHFFKLEGFAQNLMVGLVFVGSLFTKRPLMMILADSLPPQIAHPYKGESISYLKKLTLIWGFYFMLKALLFLYLAFKVDLGQLYVLRVIIGNISAVLLFGGEIFYRKKIRKA